MKRVVSVHSSRGGSGKTVIAVNLAAICASKGLNVSLLDLDFRAPSLWTVFKDEVEGSPKHWMNDFMNGTCSIEEVLIDVTTKYDTKGRLLVGLADPSMEAIRGMMVKSHAWEVSILKKLFALKRILFESMGVDYCFLDTSPGIQYSSINAVVSSDISIVVATSDTLDIEGVKEMLKKFYDVFEKNTLILINKSIPETRVWPEEEREEFLSQLRETLGHPVIGLVPCFCDVLQAGRKYLLALENPNHPFSKILGQVAEELLIYG